MRILISAATALALAAGAAQAQAEGGAGQQLPAPEATTGTPTAPAAPPAMPSEGGLEPAEGMIGKQVLGRDGEPLGEVSDVILSPDGQPLRLVIASGGGDGTPRKQIAIDFTEVRLQTDRSELQAATVTRDQVAAMPEFQFDAGSMHSLNRSREGSGMPQSAPRP